MSNPVLIELTRGAWLESRHRRAVAIADASGGLIWSVGDVDQPVFARSALKMLQALALVESGAAQAFDLSDEALALACASHSGEPMHVSAVASWLARIECGETCLACGAQSPRNAAAAQALLIEGRAPTRLHNNCSGKHAGFLTLARHLGLDPVGYERPDHPVQRLVLATIAEMAQTDLALMPVAIDGCAAPAPALPLRALAAAIARLAQPSGLAQPRAAAARRLDAAVKAHPMMVAGAGRACTQMIRAGAGAFTVKTGAEGVYVAALSTLGLGVALKIDDGATRAAETTIAALLVGLGLVVAEDPAIAALLDAPVLDTQDRIVGSRRPAAWLAAAARDAVAGRSK